VLAVSTISIFNFETEKMQMVSTLFLVCGAQVG